MKKAMNIVAVAAIGLTVAFAGTAFAGAYTHQHANSAADKASRSRGPAPKVKTTASQANKAKSAVPKPAKKGGEKARGPATYFDFHVDNRTRYYVDIYVDGDYDGAVGPYGDAYGQIHSGTHVLYGNIPGTTLSFGPRTVYVDDDFTWTLND